MKCAKVKDMLMDYVSHELPLDEEVRIYRHLTGCESCQAELESARRACDVLGALGQDGPVPNILGRVRERLPAEGKRHVLWPQLAMAISMLIITVLVANWLWQKPVSKPETVISKQPLSVEMPAVQPTPQVESPKPLAPVVANVRMQAAPVEQHKVAYKPRHRRTAMKPVTPSKPDESMVFIALEPREPDISMVQIAAEGDTPATELTVIQEFDISGNPTSITIEDNTSVDTQIPDTPLPGSSKLMDVQPADGLQAYSLDSEGDMHHA